MPNEANQDGIQQGISHQVIAIVSTIGVGLLTLLASIITTYMNNSAQSDLKRTEFESTLILKAIELPSTDKASDMISFYINSGLIQDSSGKLKKISDSKEVPIFGRDGKAYSQDFIQNVFSKWDKNIEIPEEFRKILINVADDFVNHRWHRLATEFKPTYYTEQITFLIKESDGIDDKKNILKFMKQFIAEALLADNTVPNGLKYPLTINIDEVVDVKYIGVIDTDKKFSAVKFELIFKNGGSVLTGFSYSKEGYFFLGGGG